MAELRIGDLAPPFCLQLDSGGTISLGALRGKPLVLYFYPRDNTNGCTKEAIDFSTLKPEFAKGGVAVLGISPDSAKTHAGFKARHELSVALAADEDRQAIEAYGLWVEKKLYGRAYMGVERATFLIDGEGRIAALWRNVRVAGHAETVLQAARSLSHSGA